MAARHIPAPERIAELDLALARVAHYPDNLRWLARREVRREWRHLIELRVSRLVEKQKTRRHRHQMRERMRRLRAERALVYGKSAEE